MSDRPAPGLGEVRTRRRRLHTALVQLEDSVAAASGNPETWRNAVLDALRRLEHAIDDHAANTEQPGGLFDQVEDHAPRLSASIERLRAEHVTLAAEAADLVARCQEDVPDEAEVQLIRERSLHLLAAAARHRQRGADLLWEAYEVDIAAAD